jgi:aryl-alcohol dehydrogenase-like predicted oxidoreductase
MNFRSTEAISAHVARCLRRLGTDYLDAFFLEYVQRGSDEGAAVDALRWMRGEGGLVMDATKSDDGGGAARASARAGGGGVTGPVRFLGCSTHDRDVGLRLLQSERHGGAGRSGKEGEGGEECLVDLLMARYNMVGSCFACFFNTWCMPISPP